jgi:hypothetical protein
MNSSLSIDIQVKIGSNKITLNINEYNKNVSVAKFVELAFKKSKLNNSSLYGLYECLNGVEQLIDNDIEIIAYWKTNRHLGIEFKIAKKISVDSQKRLVGEKIAKSYYKKLRPPRNSSKFINIQQDSHKDSPYLCKYHKSQLNKQLSEKISENSNFLQFLYLKS